MSDTAPIKIWGRPAALNVQKVLWCADELGIAYERIDAGHRFGVVDTEAYRRLNPNRRVPTLEDQGLVLWESNAIVRYLCAAYGMSGLCPEDLRMRADVDRWMDWQAATLYYPAFREFYIASVRLKPEERDPPKLEKLRVEIVAHMSILDAHLTERSFVGGERFTMGDVPIGTVLDKWMRLPVERPAMPALERYYERLQQRSAYRQRVTSFAVDAV
jgi:glutathione S-transferase